MANIIEIPKLNSLKWYTQSDFTQIAGVPSVGGYNLATFNPNHNFKNVDEDFFPNILPSWIGSTRYLKPIQQGDVIANQFIGKNTTNIKYRVALINCESKIVKFLDATQRTLLPSGNRIYNFEMPMYDVPEGEYVLQILKYITVSEVDPRFVFMSEPFHVKQIHENTSLIHYTNSFNDKNVFYDISGGQRFMTRVYGALVEMQPQSEFEYYENQRAQSLVLNPKTYRTYNFQLGLGDKFIPEHEIEQLNLVFECDSVYVNGIKVTRLDGAQFEIAREEKVAKFAASLKVQETEFMDSLEVADTNDLLIWTLPATESFYIGSMTIGFFGGGFTTLVTNEYFLSHRQLIDKLNAPYALTPYNLGYFTIKNNKVYWRAANNTIAANYHAELSVPATVTDLLPYMLEIDVNPNALEGFNLVVDLVHTSSIKAIAFYGDSTISSVFTGTSISITKTYTAGNYTARIFTNNARDYAITSSSNIIREIGGNLAPKTEVFDGNTVGLVRIKNNMFTQIDNGLLDNFNLVYNIMFGADVSQLIIWLYESRAKINSGATIDLAGQFLAQPINSDVVVLKNSINATITTD
jgi:hypothetical protein